MSLKLQFHENIQRLSDILNIEEDDILECIRSTSESVNISEYIVCDILINYYLSRIPKTPNTSSSVTTKTRVSNVKVSCIRPQYDNLYEWMQDSNNVYIGRKGIVFVNGKRFPQKDSIWANPYKVQNSNRTDVLQKYRKYIQDKLDTNPSLIDELLKLQGKNLGCWCYPEPCHGNILVELISKYK